MKAPRKDRLQFFKDLYAEAKAAQEQAFEELDISWTSIITSIREIRV